MRYRSQLATFAPDYKFPDRLPAGVLNKITDVPGLAVGHFTLMQDEPVTLRTGVSVLQIENVMENPAPAACHVFNGYGKSMGLLQIAELGSIESPLYLTNTLSIGAVHQGAVRVAQRTRPELRTYNPVVFECNDGLMSDIGSLSITHEMAALAHDDARCDFALGSMGAGTGMICFGFKGGIGSASRVINIGNQAYHLGVLVLTNFGRREDLRLPGLDHQFSAGPESGAGSLIMIAATDLPLLPHQLQRIARHMPQAIGILGAPGHHGSGDIALAFSTAGRIDRSRLIQTREVVADDGEFMSLLFRAAVWSTVEAIADSLFESPTTQGRGGEVRGILDEIRMGRGLA